MSATSRPNLSREVLIDTALRLLDEVGLEGLTVRRLAAELGVQSPALYWHVRGKQELLDGIADRMIRAAGLGPPRAGETWQRWLARRARAYRRSLLAHRDGARIVADASWLSTETIRAFDDELRAMAEHGFPPELALRTVAMLTQYVNGFVLQEQAEPARDLGPRADSLTELVSMLGADAARGSPLVAALRAGVRTTGNAAFEHGLRTLLAGTDATLARARHPTPDRPEAPPAPRRPAPRRDARAR